MNAQTHGEHSSGGGFPLLPVLAIAILAAGAALWWFKEGRPQAADEGIEQVTQAEPEAIARVDLDAAEIEDVRDRGVPGARGADTAAGGDTELFEQGQVIRPFVDGYDSEAEQAAQADPDSAPPVEERRIRAFDYGVLDGRVRVGVFGNGPIPRYRTRKEGKRFIIEMPGAFSFAGPLERSLAIEAFRVAGARLVHDASGLSLTVTVSPPLDHIPFVVEDTYGLMLAFEPRRPGVDGEPAR